MQSARVRAATARDALPGVPSRSVRRGKLVQVAVEQPDLVVPGQSGLEARPRQADCQVGSAADKRLLRQPYLQVDLTARLLDERGALGLGGLADALAIRRDVGMAALAYRIEIGWKRLKPPLDLGLRARGRPRLAGERRSFLSARAVHQVLSERERRK